MDAPFLFWRLNVEMQALLILAGGVTALGGSILLSALCRLFFSTPRPQPVEADRLLRREEAFKRYLHKNTKTKDGNNS